MNHSTTELPAYAELHCRSNFSFLSAASHPEELVARAAQLGYTALAITDECSLAGVVRAHEEAKRQRSAGSALQLLIGSEFVVQGQGDTPGGHMPGCRLVLLAQQREGYGHLCQLITLARLRCPKGEYRLTVRDLDGRPAGDTSTGSAHEPPGSAQPDDAQPDDAQPDDTQPDDEHPPPPGLPGCLALLIPDRSDPPETLLAQARWLAATFGDRAAIAVELLYWADDGLLAQRLQTVAAATGLPLAAAGDVRMHVRSRKPLLDVLTATRLNLPLAEAGHALPRNAEQHLRPRMALAQIYRRAWLAETARLAARCQFSLSELHYEYPDEVVPPGHSATSWLRHETEAGAQRRYPGGVPTSVQAQIEHELRLVAEMRYEAFFLTVHDIVLFARSRGILCQGRGSAANSAVCYCLGITEVDPTQTTLLFERFISRERGEPPDIDVDFEHERREEVIQYLYAKYGTHRTALAAALSTYRSRGALRDVGKALGLDAALIDAVAKSHQWFDDGPQADATRRPPPEGGESTWGGPALTRPRSPLEQRLAEQGLDPTAPITRQWLELSGTLQGFPRHLSQHSGGFVIARGLLSKLVPIEPAAMVNRRIIQWDKDDLESLGLLKVDVLALGMLSALRRTLVLLSGWTGRAWTLQDIPREDPATYAMLQRADTVGVFQVESRAQQSMLPRLKPSRFYDLVIEVAIVRPGPIQGGMVHPYLRRKQGKETSDSPYPALDAALKRTLGVPIFQEQVMQVCMIAAGFTPGEADNLRRAMAAWRRKGGVHHFHDRIISGMTERGYDRQFAEGIFRQIEGFGDYGFPESHAFGFAIIAYLSAWLKCHQPAAFTAALINSQPMGFYAPSQLLQDARRHGVTVLPVDVQASDWDCTLQAVAGPSNNPPAIRLGLRLVAQLSQAGAQRLATARRDGPFIDLHDLALRAQLHRSDLQALARADALASLAGHRRQQLWAAAAPLQAASPGNALLRDAPVHEAQLSLLEAPEGEAITLDYASTGLSLRRHPLALLRPRLAQRGVKSADELARLPDGRSVWACGLVTARQQPSTAKGTIFVTLEDETGCVNLIVWKDVRERHRSALLSAKLLAAAGTWQHKDGVRHLLARRLVDISTWLGRLGSGGALASRDFH